MYIAALYNQLEIVVYILGKLSEGSGEMKNSSKHLLNGMKLISALNIAITKKNIEIAEVLLDYPEVDTYLKTTPQVIDVILHLYCFETCNILNHRL